MMPVSGERSAPMHESSASMARAALPPIISTPSTPLVSAWQDGLDLGQFRLIGGDDELAAFAVRHAVRRAEVVEHAPAAHAVDRAQRVGRIIKAAMDHFELREDTPLAMPPVASATVTSWPESAAVRAIASPTTPAPITRTCSRFRPRVFPVTGNDYIKARKGRTMAENVVRVCAQADIAPETVKAFEVGDSRLAVYNIAANFTSPTKNAPMRRQASPTASWKATSSNAACISAPST